MKNSNPSFRYQGYNVCLAKKSNMPVHIRHAQIYECIKAEINMKQYKEAVDNLGALFNNNERENLVESYDEMIKELHKDVDLKYHELSQNKNRVLAEIQTFDLQSLNETSELDDRMS